MIKEVAFNIIVFIWERLKKEESSKLKQLSKSYPKEYENLGNKIKNFNYSSRSMPVSVLHINNCIEAFSFGIQPEYENLKHSAFDFIRANWKWIKTEEFRLNQLSSIVGPIEYQNLKWKIESPMPSYILEGRPQRISSELAEVIGLERATPHECIRRLWAYIKQKNLQDPENKQFFNPDKKMAKVRIF